MALFIKVSSLTNDELMDILDHLLAVLNFYREYFDRLGISLDNSWSKPDGYDEIKRTYVSFRNEQFRRIEDGRM